MRRFIAVCVLGCILLTGCSELGGTSEAQTTGENAQQIVMPSMPTTREEAEAAAVQAGLDEQKELMGLTYRVSNAWHVTEEDNTAEGQMISRIYTPVAGDAALDVMAKGISLIERDALAEGKRNLGSVGQFTKQWESTYGITLMQELTEQQLPPGADMGWVFESLGTGQGGQGIILIADMYMYTVYYAAEDAADNPFRDIWNAIVGVLEAKPPREN